MWQREAVEMKVAAFQYRMLLASLICALAVIGVYFGTAQISTVYMQQASSRAENTLGLAVAALSGQLARYENLPELIADQEQIKALIANPQNVGTVRQANIYLKTINTLLGSSDIYVMLPDGSTIAASNFDGPASFVGENFSYRPYFQEAIKGGEGRFFALGTTSLKRGYYFAAPIRNDQNIEGVVVFKIDVDAIEESWHGTDFEIIVTDLEGIAFMSGRKDWLFSALGPLTSDQLSRTAETRRYANEQLREIQVRRTVTPERFDLLSIPTDGSFREYLIVSEPMQQAGWTVSVLLETSSARLQATMTCTVLMLLTGLIAMGIISFRQKRVRLAERLRVQNEAKEQLEKRVIERTSDLATVNQRLKREVEERVATELQLRKTQSDLVQAGKLAALGQMSAALSHEFNQPLTAVRGYAENAATFLERRRTEDAQTNIAKISKLIDRMASISRNLRNFAREPNAELRPIRLDLVLQDTLEIIAARLKAANVELHIDIQDDALWINAGSVRLQQVLVNILSNAVDAVEGQSTRFVALSARRKSDSVIICIEDNGAGVPQSIITRIFDPFFTTKGIGKGLGLGLSISYNIIKDFDGSLSVVERRGGGAMFVIELTASTQKVAAALEDVQ